MSEIRVSQRNVEVAYEDQPGLNVSQRIVEVGYKDAPGLKVSQRLVEVAWRSRQPIYISQRVIEVAYADYFRSFVCNVAGTAPVANGIYASGVAGALGTGIVTCAVAGRIYE